MNRFVLIYQDGDYKITEQENVTLQDILNVGVAMIYEVLFRWIIDDGISQKDKECLIEVLFAQLKNGTKKAFADFLPGGSRFGLSEAEMREIVARKVN